jgi:hypothetical protein
MVNQINLSVLVSVVYVFLVHWTFNFQRPDLGTWHAAPDNNQRFVVVVHE